MKIKYTFLKYTDIQITCRLQDVGEKNVCERQRPNHTWTVKISGVMSHPYLSDIQKKI